MIATRSRPLRWPLALLCATALAACSHEPRSLPAPPPPPTAHVSSEIDQIAALLNQGHSEAAATRLKAVLKHDPADPQARVLEESLATDPVKLLGPTSFPYTVQPGETMIGLAERFLGNKLKSYALARYNGIAVPASLQPGQQLRIPGEAPHEASSPREAPREARAPRTIHEAPVAEKPKTIAPPAPVKPVANPALAARMRTAGLAALNQGKLPRALMLLRRAAQLDPGNAAIARDLDRAERISRTVNARR